MLDSAENIRALDRGGMLGSIEQLPKNLAEGLKKGRNTAVPRFAPRNIIICGMGGSSIGGDLLREWLAQTCEVNCEVVRSYQIPPYVDKNSLVIVASYSGNTEETLEMFRQSSRRRAKVIVTTSGGQLSNLADEHELPLVRLPGGMMPRASLGYMLGSMLGIVERLGIATAEKQTEEAVRVASKVVQDSRPSVPTVDNPAKRLAHELFGCIPVVIGYGLSRPVAKRWVNQFNENGKTIAFASEIPEMDHNEIVGYVEDPRARGLAFVMLDYEHANASLTRRLDATAKMFRRAASVHRVMATGLSPLAKMMSLVTVGDFTSAYLGLLHKKDPSGNEPIDELKQMLLKK